MSYNKISAKPWWFQLVHSRKEEDMPQESEKLGRSEKIVGGLVVVAALVLIGLLVFWLGWVHTIDKHELGFTYDRLTGKIEKIERNGWIVRTPLRYSVHCLDLRPYQIQISANERILNAKLVRFDPDGLETFVSWHGRSAGDNLNNLKEILKCYAFDKLEGKDCPFLIVVSDLSPNQGEIVAKPEKADEPAH